MFEYEAKNLKNAGIKKFYLRKNNHLISYSKVLYLWQTDKVFRSFFITLLDRVSFTAYRWETPALTIENRENMFEFVLIDSPRLVKTPNPFAFADHLNSLETNKSITTFPNLRGDALLIVPSLQGDISAYGHLAAFIREAPESQKHLLWQKVGQAMQQRVTAKPIWLSTAGAGVPWLHVRLDSRPKYYKYQPYKQ